MIIMLMKMTEIQKIKILRYFKIIFRFVNIILFHRILITRNKINTISATKRQHATAKPVLLFLLIIPLLSALFC